MTRLVITSLVLAASTIMASSLAAQSVRMDTASVNVIRGKNLDSTQVHALAVKQSSRPDSALVRQLVLWGDTAVVWMQTGVMSQRLRFERRKGTWTLVPESRGGWASDSAAAAGPPPPRPKPETTVIHMPPRPTRLKFEKDSAARADTLAVLKAAADSGEVDVYRLFITGDTAWVYGATLHTTSSGNASADTTAAWFEHWKARVEKRNGTWVRVSRTKQ